MPELKTRVLVVDDDQRLRELVVRYLTEQGFEVRAVPDASGMDKQLSRERSDLVVLNVAVTNDKGRRGFDLKVDLDELERKVTEVGDVVLIVIDPISSYMGQTDSHKNTEVRGVLEPISEMAERTRVAVCCVTHFSKPNGGKATKALHKFIGSIAFVAAARAAFVVLEELDYPGLSRHGPSAVDGTDCPPGRRPVQRPPRTDCPRHR